jgi:hypothetical protein
VALEGSLRDFGLADILQLIFFQRKTGVLYLEGKLDKVKLLFIEGNISGAESKKRMEANRLGKVLVKKGLLNEEDLRSVLEEQRSTNVRLGNLLIRKGISKSEDVEEVLTGQIKETVIQIFGWKEGTYEFTPQAVPVDKDVPISIDTQHLLMEGLRIVDEWALIEGKITLDAIFVKKPGFTAELSEEEKDILTLIDGENDVSTVIDLSGQDDFAVSKALLSLIEKDVIEPKEVLPVVTETLSKGTEKSAFFYRTLPLLIIIVSVLLALFSASLTPGGVFKRLLASETIDKLRFKIEAYRFEHGSYPDTLGEISRAYDPWGRSYIYVHNDYTFIVLSAGADGKDGTSDDIY